MSVKLRIVHSVMLYKFSCTNATVLDKVMSHNQWQIGVQEHHLMFKGPMELIYSALVYTFLCNGDVSVCIMTRTYPFI